MEFDDDKLYDLNKNIVGEKEHMLNDDKLHGKTAIGMCDLFSGSGGPIDS